MVRESAENRSERSGRPRLVGEAYTYFVDYGMGWPTPGFDYEAKVLGQVDRVITLDHDNVWAYYVKTVYLALSKRGNEAVASAEAGLAIDPNFARLTWRGQWPKIG